MGDFNRAMTWGLGIFIGFVVLPMCICGGVFLIGPLAYFSRTAVVDRPPPPPPPQKQASSGAQKRQNEKSDNQPNNEAIASENEKAIIRFAEEHVRGSLGRGVKFANQKIKSKDGYFVVTGAAFEPTHEDAFYHRRFDVGIRKVDGELVVVRSQIVK